MKYITEQDTSSVKGWIRVYTGWQFGMSIDKAGYFDERPLECLKRMERDRNF